MNKSWAKNISAGCMFLLGIYLCGGAFAAAVPAAKLVQSASPSLEVTGGGNSWAGYWSSGFEAVYRTLLSNLHPPNKNFSTRYAWPSPIFMGVYLWDSAFISQVWKPWDTRTAQDVNSAVLEHAVDGRLQHFASPYDKSDLTQPPVMAFSVWQNFLWNNDRDYLQKAYPVLKDYQRWLYENRRLQNGLFFWKHPYESGIDNSPRFGSTNEYEKYDTTHFAAADLSSYVAQQAELLALMAQTLRLADEAKKYQEQAQELKNLINEKLWDQNDGLYYDLDVTSGQLVKINTISSLLPLFAGVPDGARAERLRAHVMNPQEYNTLFPLPSVALNDSHFEKDCWRGPVWINTAYMVILGMERYGFVDDASLLAFKLVDGVYRNYHLTGKLVEFYDPERDGFQELHRKRGNLYKLLTLGDKPQPNFVGWTGLVNTLVIEQLIGLHKEGGKRWLDPHFPEQAQGAVFKISMPAEELDIEVEVIDRGQTKIRNLGSELNHKL